MHVVHVSRDLRQELLLLRLGHPAKADGWEKSKQANTLIFFWKKTERQKKRKKKGKKSLRPGLAPNASVPCHGRSSEWDGNRERPSGWFSLGGINVTHKLDKLDKEGDHSLLFTMEVYTLPEKAMLDRWRRDHKEDGRCHNILLIAVISSLTEKHV